MWRPTRSTPITLLHSEKRGGGGWWKGWERWCPTRSPSSTFLHSEKGEEVLTYPFHLHSSSSILKGVVGGELPLPPPLLFSSF